MKPIKHIFVPIIKESEDGDLKYYECKICLSCTLHLRHVDKLPTCLEELWDGETHKEVHRFNINECKCREYYLSHKWEIDDWKLRCKVCNMDLSSIYAGEFYIWEECCNEELIKEVLK